MEHEKYYCCICNEDLGDIGASSSIYHSRLAPKENTESKDPCGSSKFVFNSKFQRKLLNKILQIFPKVHAKSIEEEATEKRIEFAKSLEPFARKYIEYEDGMERVKATLSKDVNRERSPELKRLLWQTKAVAIMAFALKLIPTWMLEEEQFKKDYRATVFQNVKDAHQQMRIQVMSKTVHKCVRYTIPVTLFCGAILGISQFIQIYNNRTTTYDYIAALGITGGLSRLHYGGVRGLISGGVLGSVLGLMLGPVLSFALHYSGDTFEQRHVWEVCERLALEHSIIGDREFKYQMARLMDGEKVKLLCESVQG